MRLIEKFDVGMILLLLISSFVFLFLLSMFGAYSLSDNLYYQCIFEEVFRFSFCFIAWRATGYIVYSCAAFAVSELIISTIVNYLMFQPEYLVIFSDGSAIAYASVICSFLIGIMAGFLYYENVKSGHMIAWGLFLMVNVKYFFRWFPENLISGTPDDSKYLIFYLIFSLLLFLSIFVIYKRISSSKLP